MYYPDGLTPQEAHALAAHCSPELADWLDPTGMLRRGGLLVADCPSLGIPYQVAGSKEIRFD